MRDMIKGIMVIVVIITLAGLVGYVQNNYTREATVTDITNNIVTVVDTTDNEWCYEVTNDSDIEVGMNVKLKMFNNYTDNNFYDDQITDVIIM